MPRLGLVFAAAFACFSLEIVQAADSAPCVAEGRCRLKSATDSQVDHEWTSLLQTYTESRTKIDTKQAHDEALGAAGKPRRWSPAAQLLQTRQELEKAKPEVVEGQAPQGGLAAPPRQVIIASVVCCVAALLAGFVQAVLGVYNAITFHCICTLGYFIDGLDFPVDVSRATILIMCYQPIMDWVQIWNFRNEERNWYFILGYGIPFLIGILNGLFVLQFARHSSVAIVLSAFLLFSFVMVLINELFSPVRMWIKMLFSGQESPPSEGKSVSFPEKQAPGSKDQETMPQEGTSSSVESGCYDRSVKMVFGSKAPSPKKEALGSKDPETTPQEGTASSVENVCYERSAKMSSEMQESLTPLSPGSTSASVESVRSEPLGVDMSKPFTKVVVLGCGYAAGFGAGAVSVGGSFVVLMISSLQIPIAEWRVTACICEAPVHLTRLILVLALGYVNLGADGWLISGSIIGTVLGLIVGNACAKYISTVFLRGVILLSVAWTVACLSVGLYNA